MQMSTSGAATPTSAPVEFPVNLSEYMAAMGQRGDRIGGKRRLGTMTDGQRRDVASTAAKARWAKAKTLEQ
jgi:hypothetical protein